MFPIDGAPILIPWKQMIHCYLIVLPGQARLRRILVCSCQSHWNNEMPLLMIYNDHSFIRHKDGSVAVVICIYKTRRYICNMMTGKIRI